MGLLAETPTLTWNLASDVWHLFEYPFMVNAFRAGTVVAIVAGLVGWFMVMRQQTFAGHTLALVGFPGAAGAVLLGYSATAGFFVFCVAAALVIALVPRITGKGYETESAVIGTVQAFALACGFLFVSLYRGNLSAANTLLFGSFLGITSGQVIALVVIGAIALGLLAVMARPLFFASVDVDVASARGVEVTTLSVAFLVLLGVAAAEVSQITGSLLVFTLLVLPAATAQVLTPNPIRSALLTVVIGLGVTWIGLGIAYYSPYPIGFWISSVAFIGYVLARAARALRTAVPRRAEARAAS